MSRRCKIKEVIKDGEAAEILIRAKQGDPTVLPELRKLFEQRPAIWREAGDLAHHAEKGWIDLIAGGDQMLAESLWRTIEEMKRTLGGDAPTPLESLLIGQIVAAWLAGRYADLAYVQNTESSLRQGTFLLLRQRVNHERLNSALKTLAQVRKLLPGNPVLQNIEPRRSRSKTTAHSQLKKSGSPRASTARRSATPVKPPEMEAAATEDRRVDEIDGSQAPLDEDRGGDRQTGNSPTPGLPPH